jgi:hypothetical protein
MEDISPSDIALDSGYYQLTTDGLFWVPSNDRAAMCCNVGFARSPLVP